MYNTDNVDWFWQANGQTRDKIPALKCADRMFNHSFLGAPYILRGSVNNKFSCFYYLKNADKNCCPKDGNKKEQGQTRAPGFKKYLYMLLWRSTLLRSWDHLIGSTHLLLVCHPGCEDDGESCLTYINDYWETFLSKFFLCKYCFLAEPDDLSEFCSNWTVRGNISLQIITTTNVLNILTSEKMKPWRKEMDHP